MWKTSVESPQLPSEKRKRNKTDLFQAEALSPDRAK